MFMFCTVYSYSVAKVQNINDLSPNTTKTIKNNDKIENIKNY